MRKTIIMLVLISLIAISGCEPIEPIVYNCFNITADIYCKSNNYTGVYGIYPNTFSNQITLFTCSYWNREDGKSNTGFLYFSTEEINNCRGLQ